MADEKRKTKVLTIPRVKLEKAGDSAQGFFMGTNDIEGKKGLYKEAILKKDDNSGGAVTVALGVVAAKTFALIAEGQWVKITLTGTEKSQGGNFVNQYQIEVADDD